MLIFISMQPLSFEPIIAGGGIALGFTETSDGFELPPEAGDMPPGIAPAQSGPEHCSSEEGAPPLETAEVPSPVPTAALAEERTLATQVARKKSRVMIDLVIVVAFQKPLLGIES